MNPQLKLQIGRGFFFGRSTVCTVTLAAAICARTLVGANLELPDEPTLELPVPGAHQLRIISPTVLELTLVTSKARDPAPIERWNLVTTNGQLHLPDAKEFAVSVAGQSLP